MPAEGASEGLTLLDAGGVLVHRGAVEGVPLVGEGFSLLAALLWAVAVLLLRRSGETVGPFALNLYRVTVSGVLLVATVLALGLPLLPTRPWTDYLLLAASGLIGIALSDTLLHRSINMVGAGINAIVDCLYAPFAALLALLLVGERMGPLQLVGMTLVIGAVLATTRAVPPAGTDRRTLLLGILWGAAAMVTLALGVVLAKPVLTDAPVLWVVATRQVVALAAMAPVAAALPRRREIFAVLVPGPSWRFTLPATLLGSFLALMCWLAGMKYTTVGTAAILNQTSTIFILVLASLFLNEPFTPRRVASALLAFAGIVLVTLG